MQAFLIVAWLGFGLDRGVVDVEFAFKHSDDSAPDGFRIVTVANGDMRGQAGIVSC